MTSSYTTYSQSPQVEVTCMQKKQQELLLTILNIQIGTGTLDEYNGRYAKT